MFGGILLTAIMNKINTNNNEQWRRLLIEFSLNGKRPVADYKGVSMEVSGNFFNVVQNVVKQFDTPTYLYDLDAVESRIQSLHELCPKAQLRYAVKCNPNPFLLTWLKNRIASLDVSSSGELRLALQCGWDASRLAFTGPAKTEDDIRYALSVKIRSLVIEDESELRLVSQCAVEQGTTARVLIRIAPQKAEEKFAVRLAGRTTQFGVEEALMPSLMELCSTLEGIELAGLHIYSGSQCLDGPAMAAHFVNLWDTFKRHSQTASPPFDEFVFGSGMGIPYHDGDVPLDLANLANVWPQIIHAASEYSADAQLYIELGRFLVGEAGYFLTRVVRLKESKGQAIAICDGGMNNNQGACGLLGGIGHRHYSMINASAEQGRPVQSYRIVGPLCTAIDTLAHNISLPALKVGDVIAVGCSGSYGPTSSPLLFISHKMPREVAFSGVNGLPVLQDYTWIKNMAHQVLPPQ